MMLGRENRGIFVPILCPQSHRCSLGNPTSIESNLFFNDSPFIPSSFFSLSLHTSTPGKYAAQALLLHCAADGNQYLENIRQALRWTASSRPFHRTMKDLNYQFMASPLYIVVLQLPATPSLLRVAGSESP